MIYTGGILNNGEYSNPWRPPPIFTKINIEGLYVPSSLCFNELNDLYLTDYSLGGEKILKRTYGEEEFIIQEIGDFRKPFSICSDKLNNIYSSSYNYYIYKQLLSSGNFERDMNVIYNGSSYVTSGIDNEIYQTTDSDTNGKIYKRDYSTGLWSLEFSSTLGGFCNAHCTKNGDIYLVLNTYSSGHIFNIYKKTYNISGFDLLFNSSIYVNNGIKVVTSNSNADVYVITYGKQVLKQTESTGDFTPIVLDFLSSTSICCSPTNDIYICSYGNGIWKQTNSEGNFELLDNTLGIDWSYIESDKIGNIYAIGDNELYKLELVW